MEESHGQNLEGDFEGQATHTGPKGVIHDWRKFKLESVDYTAAPAGKREILRQMSSPQNSEMQQERTGRKMSLHEYELVQGEEEDERCLRRYRRRCMLDMHQKLSFGPCYGLLHELASGEHFVETLQRAPKVTLVLVHVYEDGVRGCTSLNHSLEQLAAEYPTVKFCKIRASDSGAGDRFPPEALPTLLVYRGGELIGNFVSVAEQFAQEFFAGDVESFLNEYGLLPEREVLAPEQSDSEEDAE
ncbi:phosducin [Sorex araneus]|uniref:phosducin n=1 Tax=Sorex araneus TaxID=42254 RepID=UPI0003314799|nr:phosducin [Sorex araneus]